MFSSHPLTVNRSKLQLHFLVSVSIIDLRPAELIPERKELSRRYVALLQIRALHIQAEL